MATGRSSPRFLDLRTQASARAIDLPGQSLNRPQQGGGLDLTAFVKHARSALNSFLARALLEAAELPLDAAAVRHYLGAQIHAQQACVRYFISLLKVGADPRAHVSRARRQHGREGHAHLRRWASHERRGLPQFQIQCGIFAFLHYIHHTRPDPITKRMKEPGVRSLPSA